MTINNHIPFSKPEIREKACQNMNHPSYATTQEDMTINNHIPVSNPEITEKARQNIDHPSYAKTQEEVRGYLSYVREYSTLKNVYSCPKLKNVYSCPNLAMFFSIEEQKEKLDTKSKYATPSPTSDNQN